MCRTKWRKSDSKTSYQPGVIFKCVRSQLMRDKGQRGLNYLALVKLIAEQRSSEIMANIFLLFPERPCYTKTELMKSTEQKTKQ